MGISGQNSFEGWYFKHQKGDDMVACIPGLAESGAFIQLISQEGTKQFEISNLTVHNGSIQADRCRFSQQGCQIELPGVSGEILYGSLTPLCSDIMGPFRFFPMECRHGVLSMAHTLQGSVTIDGQLHRFDGGLGYAEKVTMPPMNTFQITGYKRRSIWNHYGNKLGNNPAFRLWMETGTRMC
ncbi:hypothetical protein [Pseudoflavonifractor sp. An85]|uniref:hypothetical protein n=1 Tax=Pseudoflavonifractor sp. An85 TaxID=1965661 RepID=UPI000B3A8ADD|nr:hypothetical protein [Pseudoflavonifractor sp. An85]OUN21446.1 hypothetical protein B5G37_11135 [Pseudoflavonifractor sp. An85]